MPRARRPHPLQAAGSLPASRLPLGTPTFARDTTPAPQPAITKPVRFQLDGSHDSSDSKAAPSRLNDNEASRADSEMSSTQPSDHEQPQSFAAAKLERQNRRIAVANAALTSQPPLDKHKQTVRAKGKAWKSFDFASDIDSIASSKTDQATPAVESRVNVFRAPSRISSMSRPMSRLSSHTQDSTASDFERRDSTSTTFLESDDFQLFTGRKKGHPTIPDIEIKPSAPNATVEATFSKRDITEVFGNELPRSGFMDGNPGTIDGQLQFIQHPNGDVSAHQWSASRYGWENIGQFSNIRKKIEGQLAADRLKGETAWQSLQQNSLAYFRTVAKQREADVMGLPFGVREIAACLPDRRPPSAAPTGPRRITSKVEMPERPSTMVPREEANIPHLGAGNAAAAVPPEASFEATTRTQDQPSHFTTRFNPAVNFVPRSREELKDDLFTSADSHYNPHAARSNVHAQHVPAWGYQQQYNHHVPYGYYNQAYSITNMSYSTRDYTGHAYTPYGQSNMDRLSDQVARMRLDVPAHQSQPNTQQSHQQSSLPSEPPAHCPSFQPSNSSSTSIPKASLPKQSDNISETRTAMREHVMKMGEQAKERTKSQANIGRTVMYDPFQDQERKSPTPPEPVKQEVAPVAPVAPAPSLQSNPLGHFPLLGLGKVPGLSPLRGNRQEPFPTTLAPVARMPFSTTSLLLDNELRDSSPDNEWQRAPAESGNNPPPPTNSHTSSLKQWDADQLDEWLWSGNKFARQEDFHQRIMATPATPNRRNYSSTGASIRPIAPPSRAQAQAHPSNQDPQSNVLTNRLLVPVLENLASYVQGPVEKRRDYFCQWVKSPEWAIDRSANGNDSFFDDQWGQPPARVGRDPRYQPLPRGQDVRFGNFDAPRGGQNAAMPGIDRRFGFGGRY